MKWKYVDTVRNYMPDKYYTGKKNGVTAEVRKKANKYFFYLQRSNDNFVFNSLWGTHPNKDHQERLDNLPDMNFLSDDEALLFVEKWIIDNVPKVMKC